MGKDFKNRLRYEGMIIMRIKILYIYINEKRKIFFFLIYLIIERVFGGVIYFWIFWVE